VRVGDWNGDGIADLMGFYGNGNFTPGLGTNGVANGSFGLTRSLSNDVGIDSALGDFNGDGTADFVFPSGNNVQIRMAACANPLPMTMTVTSPAGGERWVTGQQKLIRWHKGAGVIAVDVAVSKDGGSHWQVLASGLTDTVFVWTVAGAYTENARIRVSDPAVPSHKATSPAHFAIIPKTLLEAGGGPTAFTLSPLRPNPGSGESITVEFSLPEPRLASVEIYDIGGRRIWSRDLSQLDAGVHSVEVRPVTRFPVGLYFLRLTTGEEARLARLVVLE
jgi:hypothetical protein